MSSYVSLTAKAKADLIYSQASAGAYNPSGLPSQANTWPSALDLFGESMDTPFDRYADELPTSRDRLVHAHGALARVKFTPDAAGAAKYTGIYASGAANAVIRLSLAAEPDTTHFSPGFAIKFFVDGQISANLVGMYSLDPPGGPANYDFFSYQMKTRIANPSSTSFFTTTGKALFDKGATPSNQLGCEQPSLYTSAGSLTVPPVYPRVIYLVPNPALNFSSAQHEFRVDLASLPNDTMIYTMVALDQDCDTCEGKPCSDVYASNCATTTLGTLTTTSPFVASAYVDQRIFFQHSRIDGKSRGVCKYAAAQDDAGEDSTVLPSDASSTCTPTAVGCHGTGALVSGLDANLKCPRDAYISYPSSGDSSLGVTVGAAIGGVIGFLLLAFFARRYLSRLDKDIIDADNVEGGYTKQQREQTTQPGAQYGGSNSNITSLVATNPRF